MPSRQGFVQQALSLQNMGAARIAHQNQNHLRGVGDALVLERGLAGITNPGDRVVIEGGLLLAVRGEGQLGLEEGGGDGGGHLEGGKASATSVCTPQE